MEIKWNTIMKELTELKNGEEMEKKMENYGVEKWRKNGKIMELKNGKKTLIFFYWDDVYDNNCNITLIFVIMSY